MIDAQAKNEFWDVVEDCLKEFHHYEDYKAKQAINNFSARIEDPPRGLSSDIFYHAEPFDIACDIADKDLELEPRRPRYNKILRRHYW